MMRMGLAEKSCATEASLAARANAAPTARHRISSFMSSSPGFPTPHRGRRATRSLRLDALLIDESGPVGDLVVELLVQGAGRRIGGLDVELGETWGPGRIGHHGRDRRLELWLHRLGQALGSQHRV